MHRSTLFCLFCYALSQTGEARAWDIEHPEPGYEELHIDGGKSCRKLDVIAGYPVSLEARVVTPSGDLVSGIAAKNVRLVAILPPCDIVLHAPNAMTKSLSTLKRFGSLKLRQSGALLTEDPPIDLTGDLSRRLRAAGHVQASAALDRAVTRTADHFEGDEPERIAYCVGKGCTGGNFIR